ncbi:MULTISPECIES: ABC transporter permease [Sphingobacterium]|jgi:putative ABC transport system permease protein|uniref:ABC transporter permease n=1 Tax=Sphingobacterium TaxID=28453 RepID=UPI00097EE3A3|nr:MULTISPECIES: ABC transporter permease [Sphingobacterium]UXD68476.1 ABC transporter permease [Sphingobacterium faecium]WGQ16180.1 ABC transporter permease [Sphingobacterium faecium]SJN42789.1 putative ABC transporter permease [Sphingobacterium faecium PCAi_F2.5]
MINNYIKIAWRNLLKNKAFSSINIIGLAIGMAGALLIALWLQNMLSMDRFHMKGDRLYVISNRDMNQGQMWAWVNTPKIMGPTLKKDFPDIEKFTRYDQFNNFLTTYNNKKIVSQVAFVDPGFFDMFSFPIVKGNKNKLLQNANSVVLTQKFAETLFGNSDPVGKTIKIDSVNLVTVDAVLQDLPNNTSMQFDYLLSWEYAKKIGYTDENWQNNSIETYVLLRETTPLEAFNNKIRLVSQNHINVGNNEIRSTNEIFAFPYQDAYLYNKSVNGAYTAGRIQLVHLFTWIGSFILLVACINFMNLSTARSERRAKEVGVRKVVGADRKSLIAQFIVESVLISFAAMILAVGCIILILPAFNNLVEKNLHISLLSGSNWLFLIIFTIITGVLAGSYPAFFLSSFKPLKTLKGKLNSYKRGLSVRSILVILQFSIAIILTIATIIIFQQIQHTKDRDRGYDDNGLLVSSISGELEKNYLNLRNELLASNAVVSVSKNMSPVTDRYSNGMGFSWPGSSESDKKVSFNRFSTDADAVENLGFTLLSGRDIDIYKYKTDSNAMLLTETAVKSMRLQNPIGQVIHGDREDWTVVGVIKDFIVDSPYGETLPMIIFGPKSWFTNIHYRLNPNNSTVNNLKTVADIFKKFNPDYPFEYKFIDKNFEAKFKETQSIGTLSMLFAVLTIFISCLGLFALIAYMAETRMKEIAVRKVLGASIGQLTSLLSVDFIKLVLMAILIASPIAWWVMDNWLQDYNYRIEIQWQYFAAAGLMAILISLATISFQTIKAALSNPVDSLRDE